MAKTRVQLSGLGLESRIVPAADYILTNEHADVQVGFSGGTWAMLVRDKDLNADYPSVSSLGYVNTAYAQNLRPIGGQYDFIGVGASQPYYRLPQIQNPNLLYHGFGAESVAPGTFGVYDPAVESHGRESGAARWVKLQLTGFNGPGAFSVFRSGDAGPIRYMSTYDDGVANPEADGIDYTDGISSDDAFWMLEGSHVHLNFGFTAQGRYRVWLTPSALIGGTLQTGTAFEFVYSVDHVGQMSFVTANYSVSEGAGSATVTLTRTGAADGAISVDYATTGGTATADVDYTPTSGTVTFFDLETVKSFTIPITNDLVAESPETIGLTLSNFRPWNKPGGGPEDPPLQGSTTAAVLTVVDNESPTPARVNSVVINGGDPQRSRVTSVQVTFDQVVTLPAAPETAFQVVRQGDSAQPTLVASVGANATGTVVSLTFTGTLAVDSNSLADGRYTFIIDAAKVSNANGQLDGDNNGIAGGDFSLASAAAPDPPTNIFRLFGDANGDGAVSNSDFNQFRLAYGGTGIVFDSNGDGSVSNNDFNQFRARFGASI